MIPFSSQDPFRHPMRTSLHALYGLRITGKCFDLAQLRASTQVQSLLDGPIAAIETRDDVLDMIRDTRLSDPDSWRKVIQGVPSAERKYLGQVHDMLGEMATEYKGRTRNAFIYNFKQGGCLYYDLGS
jgi:translation initiation factor 2-alpha kinase 4